MSYENVLTENRDGILWLTVNRPEKLNALNRATLGEISDAIEAAGNDGDVWAVVVTGAGEKAFVAGADIGELNTLGPVEAKEFALRGQAIYSQIERLTKPVVAAVNGFALGGGCELAMACHLRVASSNAIFGQPEVKLGLIPGYAGTQRLPRLVGRGRALEILRRRRGGGENRSRQFSLRPGRAR
jgi:enoyl-CoA hydratase